MKEALAPSALIERSCAPGLHEVRARRNGIEEIFVTASREDHAAPEAMFARVAKTLERRGARPLSQEVFGIPRDVVGLPALRASLGEPRWPVTWVEDGAENLGGIGGTQVWAVAGCDVSAHECGGDVVGCVFEDAFARYGVIGGMVPPDAEASPYDQAAAVFDRMQSTLHALDMDFRDVVRTWFYNRRILEWYGPFNQARTAFFNRLELFHAVVPASTGIGGCNPAGAALTAHAFAVRPKHAGVRAFAVPSPLQCPAIEYGSAFSRALEVATPDGARRLTVSGTASIAPEGATQYVGDIDAQIARTMEVVEAILQERGMEWSDVTRAIAYFKDGTQTPPFRRYCESQGLAQLPVLCVHQDVCRDDLLFEVEADSMKLG